MPCAQIRPKKDRVGKSHQRVKHERQHDHRKEVGQNVDYVGGNSHSGANAERSMGMKANAASRISERITALARKPLFARRHQLNGQRHTQSYGGFQGRGNLAGKTLDCFFGFRFHHHARQ